MELYLKDYLIIGSDFGDMAFVLAIKEKSPVWRVDEGSLRTEDFEYNDYVHDPTNGIRNTLI